jgi:hypothetical protein
VTAGSVAATPTVLFGASKMQNVAAHSGLQPREGRGGHPPLTR